MLAAAATGFGIGFSLILAIGAQNAFVLRQGLMQSHVFLVCLVCALSDAILISVGIAGSTVISTAAQWTTKALAWGSAAFLIVYGTFSFCRAIQPSVLRADGKGAESRGLALITCLTLTWLNPHVYLDTVGLIGAVSTRFENTQSKLAFGLGATAASFLFFFSLGYGARYLAPVFSKPRAWAAFDIGIGLVMWSIAATLISGLE